VVERWVVTPSGGESQATAKVVPFTAIWDEIDRVEPSLQ